MFKQVLIASATRISATVPNTKVITRKSRNSCCFKKMWKLVPRAVRSNRFQAWRQTVETFMRCKSLEVCARKVDGSYKTCPQQVLYPRIAERVRKINHHPQVEPQLGSFLGRRLHFPPTLRCAGIYCGHAIYEPSTSRMVWSSANQAAVSCVTLHRALDKRTPVPRHNTRDRTTPLPKKSAIMHNSSSSMDSGSSSHKKTLATRTSSSTTYEYLTSSHPTRKRNFCGCDTAVLVN